MFTIIVGGGQVGAYLAKLLLAEKHQLKIVEQRRERVEVLQRILPAELVVWAAAQIPVCWKRLEFTRLRSSPQ